MKKPVTYTIPEQLDIALHTKIGRGKMSQFVTQALWEALKRDEDALLAEFLDADNDVGNIEVKQDLSQIEGEDFIGLDDFNFGEERVRVNRKYIRKKELSSDISTNKRRRSKNRNNSTL